MGLTPPATSLCPLRGLSETPPAERVASGRPLEGAKPVAPGKRKRSPGYVNSVNKSPSRGDRTSRFDGIFYRSFRTLQGFPLPPFLIPGCAFDSPGPFSVRPVRAPKDRLAQLLPEGRSPIESHRRRRWFTLLQIIPAPPWLRAVLAIGRVPGWRRHTLSNGRTTEEAPFRRSDLRPWKYRRWTQNMMIRTPPNVPTMVAPVGKSRSTEK